MFSGPYSSYEAAELPDLRVALPLPVVRIQVVATRLGALLPFGNGEARGQWARSDIGHTEPHWAWIAARLPKSI